MRTLRPFIIVLGLVLIAGGTAYAATPEEQAASREEARRLTEQVRGLEQQAVASREQTRQIFLGELKKADGFEDQADTRMIAAYQKWLQGAAPKQAQASVLRESARSHQHDAYELGLRAATVDMRAESARSRETRFRAASEALLAGTPDAETRAIAKELNQQATAEGRAAKSLESESASLLRQQAAAIKSSDALIARAVKLETASP